MGPTFEPHPIAYKIHIVSKIIASYYNIVNSTIKVVCIVRVQIVILLIYTYI